VTGNIMMLPPKPEKLTPSANQAGFTIIESLMAIIVVSILMIAIAPVIVLSVATRVQARRVEMATQAAQGYIDALRAETIDAPPINEGKLKNIPAPDENTLDCDASSQYCAEPSITSNPSYQLYCVDGNGGGCTNDNFKDMIVQAFGVNTATSTNTDPQEANQERAEQGYHVGIRVYRADAFGSTTLVKSDGERESTFTGGTGLKPQQQPLIELTTEIIPEETTYTDFCSRVGCEN
jgi:prepilin-type N-terminal cleavage/methylation domain-containing protein